MKNQITLHNLLFDLYIQETHIHSATVKIAQEIEHHYKEMPLLLGVLNGSFIFASDLCRAFHKTHEIEFIKYHSYRGMESDEKLQKFLGIDAERVKNRRILLVEDIVDTGNTIAKLSNELLDAGAIDVECVTAFFKPAAFQGKNKPRFVAMECENKFLVGYGMDYNGIGRHLSDLYILAEEN